MTLLALITFNKILGFNTYCKNYEEDTPEYKKCVKMQELADEMLEQFYTDNQKLFEKYMNQAQNSEVVDFMNIVHHMYNKIDDEVYVDMNGLNVMIDDLDELSENIFDLK